MAQKAEVPYLAILGDCKDFLLLCGLFVLGGIGPLRFEGDGVEAVVTPICEHLNDSSGGAVCFENEWRYKEVGLVSAATSMPIAC